MATRLNPPKKVRLACRRCRARRIKCDGQSPACTNCAKAGEVCLDVGSQNSGVSVPRNFAGAARARIQWLESIIQDRLPDVDLRLGPQVEPYPDANATLGGKEQNEIDDGTAPIAASRSSARMSQPTSLDLTPRPSSKRAADTSPRTENDGVLSGQAHSVALNLGMLSLNSDSSQRHYLGSSSGILFTNLIGASPSTPGSSSVADGDASHAARAEWPGDESARNLSLQNCRSIYTFLKQELPRKEDALVLVHTYIRWVHPDYPILEPSSLLSSLYALYSCVDNFTEEDLFHSGWPTLVEPFRWNGRQTTPRNASAECVPMPVIAFILFMVFNIASIIKIRSRVYEYPPERFYRAATHFSRDAFSQISLSSIQGLVCLIIHGILTPADVNIWTLVHIGLAHCVELGIHREESLTEAHDAPYQQIKRFVFYTIYSLDRSVSSIQGRPLGFRDETFDIKMPEPQGTEADYVDGLIPASFPAAVTRYATHQFELDRIISDIKLHFYHLPGFSACFPQPDDPSLEQARIYASLDDWWNKVSAEDFVSQGIEDRQRQIWQGRLKAKYHSTVVLLFQPSQVIRKPSSKSLKVCFDNASAALREYQALHDLHGLHHGWRTVQSIFAAGATLIYSFWTCAGVRRDASPVDLSKSLRTCSNLLSVGGEWWPSVKKGQDSFGAIADLTIRKLYTDSLPSKQPRLMNQDIVTFNNSGGSTSPSGSHMQALTGADDSWYQMHGPAMNMSLQHETWQDNMDPIIGSNGGEATNLFPEIETFLAEFDRSDFSWSFPLNDLGDGFGSIPGFNG